MPAKKNGNIKRVVPLKKESKNLSSPKVVGKSPLKKAESIKKKAANKISINKKRITHDQTDWKTRFETISSAAGLVVYDYDIRSGDILWSGTSEEVLGFKPEELGNIDRWVEFIHPEDRTEAFTLLEKAQELLKPYDVYYRFSKKNGEYCYMHDRGTFITDKKGKAVRMLGIMNDDSKRILAEKTIHENNLFRVSLESAMPGILYVYDVTQKTITHANRNIFFDLGFSPEDLKEMGNGIKEKLIHPEDLKPDHDWSNEPDGVIRESDYRILNKSGQYKWFMNRITPFQRDESGRIVKIIGIAQDITSKKEALYQRKISEQSYLELFNTVDQAIYLQNPDGTFIDVNKGACLMFGYDKEEMIGRDTAFFSAEGKNDTEAIRKRMRIALKGIPQAFEFWGRKRNGEIFLQEIRITKASHFDKEILLATGLDITQRRKTEKALTESEERFKTLQSASFGGIGLHDQGTIIDCNEGLCDITGYNYEELIGKFGLELIAPEWRDFVWEKIKTGYEKPYDVEGIRKDGSRYILEIRGKNIPFQDRKIRVTEFRDITDRKKTEEQIISQNSKLLALTDDLLRKNNQMDEFTQIVSHNLRSPVGNIVTLLNFLEGAVTETEKKEYLNLLKESSATTLYMLNDLNEVLKIKQNKNIEKEELKFETVLNHVRTMLNAKISHLSAELSYDFTEAPSIIYPAIYLESILLNLLDNALKYAHSERAPRISFKSTIDAKGHTVLAITDNGLGINLQKYGHQVFKLRKTFHHHPESRGIGLFMIKNQIEAMGGEISVDSKESEGSTFFINFNKLN